MTNIKVNVHNGHNWHFHDCWQITKLTTGVHLTHDDKSKAYLITLEELIYADQSLIDQMNDKSILVVFELTDISDYGIHGGRRHSYAVLEQINTEIILVTQNHFPLELGSHITVIQYDLLHNRSKLYYTSNLELAQSFGFRPWYYRSDNFKIPWLPVEFVVNQIEFNSQNRTCNRSKKFLFASYSPRAPRFSMALTLKDYQSDGYYYFGRDFSTHELDSDARYVPFNNTVYNDSFINVFNETNILNGIWHKTEKTLEPIIHSQMILPLASQGYNSYIKSCGYNIIEDLVITPWDHIEDHGRRTDVYCENMKTVLERYSINDLNDIYYDNLKVTLDNKNNFFDTPFCRGMNELTKYI